MNKAQDRIAALYAAAIADGCTAETATARVLDRMLAARLGRWRYKSVRLPESMARQLLAYAEALDATVAKLQRWARQGRVKPMPPPLLHEEALRLATALHAGRPVQIGSVLRVYLMWKKATKLAWYHAGNPSFLAGWRQPPQQRAVDTQPRRPTADVDWGDYAFTWNDFKDEPEQDDDTVGELG